MQAGESIKAIQHALDKLRQGEFVLIHDADDRENETDFVIAAEFVKDDSIRFIRKNGGGLIFLMISHEIAEGFQLPFLSDLFADVQQEYPVLKHLIADDIPYDTKSSFSLYINHRDTFTGITDKDRSLTISSFAELTKKLSTFSTDEALQAFGKQFRSPGHVPICVASEKPLTSRFGHTELSTALLKMAGLHPVASGCEIMGDDGNALSKKKAQKLAEEHGFVFIEGEDIIQSWNQWSR